MDLANLTRLSVILWIAGVVLEILLGTVIAYRKRREGETTTASGSAMASLVFAMSYGAALIVTNGYPRVQIGITVVSILLMCWINSKLATRR